MQEDRFKIIVSGEVVAENLASDIMLLLVKAFFEHFFAEDEITIQRQNYEPESEEKEENGNDEDW